MPDHDGLHESHQVAYVLDARPTRRTPTPFAPLLDGAEGEAFRGRRRERFEEAWEVVRGRIEAIVRESNSATLEGVSRFVEAWKLGNLETWVLGTFFL
ncbi:hypothetical protein E4U42_003971 [Claviceps africana]|uniref:Uncharacterized protein n=1 Tax=Claviceps africana TaxID=83212 RepID=A0A8K0JEQ7_9HYPO|nr:hypothetical protein E4U42_003971 [Claviceps africana]